MFSARPCVEIDTGKMCSNSAPAAYSVWRGPGTLETVMLAAGGSTSDRLERLYSRARIWTTIGAPSIDRLETCGISARSGCDISLDLVDCAMIASRRCLGSSTSVAIEQIMPNTWLLASVLPSSRSEIGTAAVIGLAGNAPCSSRYRRTTPLASASTTSLSLPPDALATAFARDSEIDTPAKLRSEEIALFRMVEGDAMLAMLSRDFGSATLPRTSETPLIMFGRLPANFTALSIWNMALSNSTDPISLLPLRGSSMPLAAVAPSSGWRHSC